MFKEFYFLCFCAAFTIVSCVDTKKVTYFYNQGDTTLPYINPIPDPLIQVNNILNISVSSLNSEASSIFNRAIYSSKTDMPGEISYVPGYLVNSDGYIQFPILGNVKAEGLTKLQLKELITSSLKDKKLLLDPMVTVRVVNYKVTVLGEVNRPGVISVPSERITLLEALGFAGDLTLYAKRDAVLLIRDDNGKKTTRRLNLNSGSFFNSPYYYLKSDDVVYVEANKAKVASTGNARIWLPVIFSALSLTAIVIDRLTR